MAQKLAGGNGALALLCNTLPTGAILVVLILVFGPLSGAHFNPAVSLAFALRDDLPWSRPRSTSPRKSSAAIAGVWTAHLMFDLPVWQISITVRTGAGQWLAEAVATFGLLLTIFGCVCAATGRRAVRGRPLYHGGLLVHGVDVLRQSGRHRCALLSDTFAGIAPAGAPAFIVAQLAGALAAVVLSRWLWREPMTA